ncbi:MAG TPA: hypothetical protein ENK13_01405, partial [Thermopetrobacter sp.]|nr:hypothetical protein [Thermopetrobacter sp.]
MTARKGMPVAARRRMAEQPAAGRTGAAPAPLPAGNDHQMTTGPRGGGDMRQRGGRKGNTSMARDDGIAAPDRRRFLRLAGTAAGGLLLGACSQTDSLVNDLLGETGLFGERDVRLPGQREDLFGDDAARRRSEEPVAIPAAVRNTSWAQPGGRASNANQNLALGRPLRRAFSASAGAASDSDGRISAPPIVIAGRVHVLDAKATVTAVSASGGRRLWSTSLVPKGEEPDVGFGGGLCSDGARVYAATGFGEVVALDAASGRILWRHRLELPVRTAPVVAAGRIYVRDNGNTAYALSAADGAEIWRHQGEKARASLISAAAPAVGGGIVAVPFTTGDVAVFSPSGSLLWSQNIGTVDAMSDIAARPVIHDGMIHVIPAAGNFSTFRARNGGELWAIRMSGRNTPWLAGAYLFVIADRDRLVAVNRKDGSLRWTTRLGGGVWQGPVMGGGRLL